jgi:hypothetical protein
MIALGADDALRAAQQLIVVSAEFNTLAVNVLTPSDVRTQGLAETVLLEYNCFDDCTSEGNLNAVCSACGAERKCCRAGVGTGTIASGTCAATEGCGSYHCCGGGATPFPAPPAPAPPPSTYKAIVVLYLEGGCDSFNLLAPHSGCGTSGGYAQYANIRQDIALQQSALLPVTANVFGTNNAQPCTTYGVHPSMPTLKRLYDAGDALFVANAGPLIEPVTKSEYMSNAKPMPKQLFAHNTQQHFIQNLDASMPSTSSGVLGRMVLSFHLCFIYFLVMF